jgi:hypothetical protein
MTNDGVLLQSLSRGLNSMRNISSIVYSPRQHLIPAERKDLRDLLPRGAYQGRPHSSRVTAPDHPFRQLIGSVLLSQYTGIRELSVEGPPRDEPSTQFGLGIFTFPDPNDLKAGRHLFRHLIRIDLNVSLDGSDARLRHNANQGHGFGGPHQMPSVFNPANFPAHAPPHPVGGTFVFPNTGSVGFPNLGPGPATGPTMTPHAVIQAVTTAAAAPNSRASPRTSPIGAVRQLQNLTRCLKAAQDLRHLSLCIPGWSESAREMYGHIFPDGRPIFHSLGLWFTWSKLRSLSLEGIYADERDITNLVERHKNSLRSLNFSKCSLCTGTWAKVVYEVISNASMITVFTLDNVNEVGRTRYLEREERESWRYEGYLVVAENGEREFVCIRLIFGTGSAC